MFRSLCALHVLLAGLVLLGACERPFIEERRPAIEVVSDLSQAFSSPTLALQVTASSFRQVDSVTVNGAPMQYAPGEQAWTSTLRLSAGLNTLRIVARDVAGLTAVDTAYALYFPVSYTGFAPSLPAPRGGHTATLLPGGTLLVAGGASNVGGDALGTALLLRPNGPGFVPTGAMQAARTGHTATLLPDGRVLVLGGSRSDEVDELEDLVAPVELYDPATDRFTVVPYEGAPIRRAFHSAAVREAGGRVYLDLFGGRGDIRYGTSPRLGVRDDLSIYEFRNDSLVARSPGPGGYLEHAAGVWGHTEVPLQSPEPSGLQRYLVAGSYFTDGQHDDVSFVVDYTTNLGIISRDAPVLPEPRTRHAATLLRPGHVFVVGGMQGSPSTALAAPLLYADEARQYFRLPAPPSELLKRFGLTATKIGSDRILLIGGFSLSGNGIAATEVVEAASF